MVLRNGVSLLCLVFVLFVVCFVGQVHGGAAKIVDPPVPGFVTPNTTIKDCIFHNVTAKEVSFFSTEPCKDRPIVQVLAPKTTNFTVGTHFPRNVTVAAKFELLQSYSNESAVRYLFGECDVLFCINEFGVFRQDCGFSHANEPLSNPLTPNEKKLDDTIGFGPEGITLSAHNPGNICHRDCKALNPDGTINFTQVFTGPAPAVKLTFFALHNESLDDLIIGVKPEVTIQPQNNLPPAADVKIDRSESVANSTTKAPSETSDQSGLEPWVIAVIVVGVLLVVLVIVGIVGFLLYKRSVAANAAKKAAAMKTQERSAMGTVTSQMGTTAGTTVGDENQINVVVQT